MNLLTTPKTAEVLHVSPRTLERMRQEGTGPVYRKAGRRVLYFESDVMEWLNSRSFGSTAEAQSKLTGEKSMVETEVFKLET